MEKLLNYKTIIFDFDGTLADTLIGILDALNDVSKSLNLGINFSYEDGKKLIGGGSKRLFLKAFNYEELNDKNIDIYNLFMDKYQKYQLSNFKLYKNVEEMLEFFNENNINLIIYSNKPDNILKLCVEKSLGNISFVGVIGNTLKMPPKPDPSYLLNFLNEKNIDVSSCLYVGDSIYDLLLAKNMKIDCVICNYGYGDYNEIKKENPTYEIDDFKLLERIVLKNI